jgi:hypothetical protein
MAFLELESAIRSATRGKSACYGNLPPGRAAKPYLDDYGYPALWQSLLQGLAPQSSQAE